MQWKVAGDAVIRADLGELRALAVADGLRIGAAVRKGAGAGQLRTRRDGCRAPALVTGTARLHARYGIEQRLRVGVGRDRE